MTRFLNLILITALVAAAIGVYSIKYEATLQAEKVAKLQRAIETERVAIAALKAEWANLARPERLEDLARKHLDLQPMRIDQIVKAQELPEKAPEGDVIARKLEGLGLGLGAAAPDETGSTP
jgi:cell division protein FtsL